MEERQGEWRVRGSDVVAKETTQREESKHYKPHLSEAQPITDKWRGGGGMGGSCSKSHLTLSAPLCLVDLALKLHLSEAQPITDKWRGGKDGGSCRESRTC